MRLKIEKKIIMKSKHNLNKPNTKISYFYSNIALLDEDFDLFSPEVIDLFVSNKKK
jgi:hypothetical protein